jgi:hypothetical protein
MLRERLLHPFPLAGGKLALYCPGTHPSEDPLPGCIENRSGSIVLLAALEALRRAEGSNNFFGQLSGHKNILTRR